MKHLSPFELVLITLISLQTLYNFFRAMIKPIESYDSVAIYGIKSKIIYFLGGLTPAFFKEVATYFPDAHPDYPLLVPLAEAWVYAFLGRFNDVLVKSIFPLYYLAFILVFYAALRRITKNTGLSLLFTFLLATVKQFSDYATIGYADMELGIYFGVAMIYMYLYLEEKKPYFLNISLVASALCLWTKNEGMLLAAISAAALLFYAAGHIKKLKRARVLHMLLYALVIFTIILSWGVFKGWHSLINENFNLSMVSFGNLARGLGKIPAILYEYQKQFFGFKKWNIIWILFALVFVAGFKTAFSKNLRYLTTALVLFGLAYTLMYIFSAVDIKFFLDTSGSRFPLHILPVAVFWMGIISWKNSFLSTGTA